MRFFVCVAAFAPLVALWSIATPVGAAPDEYAHIWHAAAIVRGQLAPRPIQTETGEQSQVSIPVDLWINAPSINCFAFKSAISASCAHRHVSYDVSAPGLPKKIRVLDETVDWYPPPYYALVGAPTLVNGRERSTRAASAVLAVVFLGLALYTLRRHAPNEAWSVGLATAVTPSALFLAGVTNPSGPQIAAAIALWAALVVLARDDADRRRPMWTAACAGAAVVLLRPDGVVVLAIVLALAAVYIGYGRVRAMAINREAVGPLALVAGAAVGYGAWVLAVGPPRLIGYPARPGSKATIVRTILVREGIRFKEMVGLFGWNDTSAPRLTIVVWTAVTALLIVVAVRWSGRRIAYATIATVVAVLALELVLEVPRVHAVGYLWTGRYSLPIATGIPLMSASSLTRRLSPRWVIAMLIALGAGQVAAFWWTLHRYTVGELAPLFARPKWQPPGGSVLLIALYGGAVGVFLVMLARPSTAPSPPRRQRARADRSLSSA